MELIGIGNDIIEIERIKKAILNINFLNKVYTDNEKKIFLEKGNREEVYAGRFSIKESISKALGTGVRGFKLTDIEILNDELGKPYVVFKNDIEYFNDIYRVEISISHCKMYVVSTAIIFKK